MRVFGRGSSLLCQNCVFQHCTIGADAHNSAHLTLDQCCILKCYMDGLVSRDEGTRVVARDCSIEGCGSRGVTVSDAAELLLTGCRVDHNGEFIIILIYI